MADTVVDGGAAPKAARRRVKAGDQVAHKGLDDAVLAVMADCPYVKKTGEMKSGAKVQYTFASDRDLIEALQPLLRRHRLTFQPVCVELLFQHTYQTQAGATWNRVALKVTYLLRHADTEQERRIEVTGEGADPGDKTCSKAMTTAHKYALRQAFNIETGDDPDGEAPAERADPGAEAFFKAREAVLRAKNQASLNSYRELFGQRGFTQAQLDELTTLYWGRAVILKKAAQAREKKAGNGQQQPAGQSGPAPSSN